MKDFRINRNSWHYKIVNHERIGHAPDDLCSYVRVLLIKSLLFFALGVLFSLVSVSWTMGLGISIAAVVASAVHGIWLLEFEHIVLVSITAFGVFVWAYIRFGWKFLERKDELSEPGFVRMAVKSKLNKFCTRIKYE